MRIPSLPRSALLCLFTLWILAGCSSRFEPTAPDAGENGGILTNDQDPIQGDRSISNFEEMLKASQHDHYVELAGSVGAGGGSVGGSVAGYDHAFSLQVPGGACQSLCTLRILVPTEGVPVYQLLPHRNFGANLTVTLDYSLWIDEGAIGDGHLCEVLYMNEETGQYETLSPRALFIADGSDASISFTTNHFSRWIIEDLDDD